VTNYDRYSLLTKLIGVSRHILIVPILLWIAPRVRTCTDLETLDCGSVLYELDLEKHVSILKEAFFETNNHELTGLEVFLNHKTDVLSVGEVQS
jgi:hypothetical protein